MKPTSKLLIGMAGVAPLSAALIMLMFPEMGTNIGMGQRLFLVIFLGLVYCFGLIKWVDPNG